MNNFDIDLFSLLLDNVLIVGIATGFVIGFLSWSIGFAIYTVIKWFKMA